LGLSIFVDEAIAVVTIVIQTIIFFTMSPVVSFWAITFNFTMFYVASSTIVTWVGHTNIVFTLDSTVSWWTETNKIIIVVIVTNPSIHAWRIAYNLRFTEFAFITWSAVTFWMDIVIVGNHLTISTV